jgi:hypothetical protein
MNKSTFVTFCIATLLLQTEACNDNSVGPSVPHEVTSFIQSQDLPKTQKIKIVLEISQEDITVFKVSYGEAHDCPSGCFYSIAFGLKSQIKVAWLKIEDYDTNDLSHAIYYNFDSTETFLFSSGFWDQLNQADSWIYHYAYLQLLAPDEDVPLESLQRIAEDLYTFIDDHLASLLLLNPKVQINRPILNLLANLPVFQDDAYRAVREKARQLLNALGNKCGQPNKPLNLTTKHQRFY